MNQQEELTLKEIIEIIRNYTVYLLTKWKTILLFSFLLATLFGLSAYFKPIKYSANLSFMVNEDDTGIGMSSMPSVLGQFGFIGGGGGKYNRSKILELAKSRKIATLVMFEKVIVNGQMDYMANHILNEYNLIEKWISDYKELENFRYVHNELDSFTRQENLVLLRLYRILKGDPVDDVEGLITSYFDEETGILYFNGLTKSELLSLNITNLFYEKLSKYYIEKTIEKQQATFQVFKVKVDSLERVLNATNNAILKFDDSSRNLSLKQYQAKRYKLQSEANKLSNAYTEAYKSLQVAELALENKTPFITTIDRPITPLRIVRHSVIKELILGLFIGLFSAVGFYSGWKFFSDLGVM